MNEQNFVKRLNWLVSGDAFLAEKEIPLSHILDATEFTSVLSSAAATSATGTITFAGVPDDRDAIRVGDTVYHFDATTLNDHPGQVLIGASATLTADNFVAAIMNTGTEGTDYGTGTGQNAQVTAVNAAGVVTVTARYPGAWGNTIAIGPAHLEVEGADSGVANVTFGADFLAGGTGVMTEQTVVPTIVAGGISFDDGETALLRFMIPQDYCQDTDEAALRINYSADGANGTTDIGITTAQTIWRPGSAADATASTAAAETALASANVREVILALSGRSYQPGDVVQLTLDANAASTDELVVHGISLIYGSNLAAYNDDDRWRDMTSSG